MGRSCDDIVVETLAACFSQSLGLEAYSEVIGVGIVLMALPPVIVLPVSYFVLKEKFGWQAVAGTVLAGVQPSNWLLLCTIMISLFLALGKRRHELVLLADKYGIPIIEDDPYGQLRFEGEHLPPLLVLDRENLRRDDGKLGNVIYLSTFSKTLAPGIRLGWIVAPPDVITKLVQLKQGADLHSSTFDQMVAYEVVHDGFLDEHVKKIRAIYRERRDVMLAALAEYFPPEVTWTHPHGGLFLWVTLPEGMDMQHLFQAAVRENVAFVPGDCFYPGGDEGNRHMRLNFSHSTPQQIREGIRRLGLAVARELAAHHPGVLVER